MPNHAIIFNPINAELVHQGFQTSTCRLVHKARNSEKLTPGMILPVRERYCQMGYYKRPKHDRLKNRQLAWEFVATGGVYKYDWDRQGFHSVDLADPFTPKLYNKNPFFMPNNLSRTTILIEDVILKRLNDITDEDVMQEGYVEESGRYGLPGTFEGNWRRSPLEAYADEWELLHGKDSWTENPEIIQLVFKKI